MFINEKEDFLKRKEWYQDICEWTLLTCSQNNQIKKFLKKKSKRSSITNGAINCCLV